MLNEYTSEQITEHNKADSLWVLIHNNIYDVTKFLNEHPGGKKVLVNVGGKDATEKFDLFHKKDVLVKYGEKYLIGKLKSSSNNFSSPSHGSNTIKIQKNALSPIDFVPKISYSDNSSRQNCFGEMVPYGDPTWYQKWSSPYYNESHRRFRSAIREFVEKEIIPYCHEWDENKHVPHELYIKAGKSGWLALCAGLPYPREYLKGNKITGDISPNELDHFHLLTLYDELGRCGSGGVCWAISGGLSIGLPPVLRFGSNYLKEKVVRSCLNGEKVICLAITEPYAGSDVANIRCRATKTPDGKYYIVNGEKKWITNGVFADYFTTAVRTGGEGMGGISLLLIERGTHGIKTTQMNCMGVWASGTTYITFEDVKVPVENLVGKEGNGFKYIMYNFNHERWVTCIGVSRFSRVLLEESIKYSEKRKTFGKKLIEHPIIREKIGNMTRKVEANHAWLELITYQMDKLPIEVQDKFLGGTIALCKAQCTTAFEYCAREAAQIFGGLSYTRGGQGEKVERLYREVRAYAIPAGSEEIMIDFGVRQAIKMLGTKI